MEFDERAVAKLGRNEVDGEVGGVGGKEFGGCPETYVAVL